MEDLRLPSIKDWIDRRFSKGVSDSSARMSRMLFRRSFCAFSVIAAPVEGLLPFPEFIVQLVTFFAGAELETSCLGTTLLYLGRTIVFLVSMAMQ